MHFTAIHRCARSSAQKARLVADAVRGKPIPVVLNMLSCIKKKPAELIRKVLLSAVANATTDRRIERDRLRIHRIYVDVGPHTKRTMLRAKGRSDCLLKRTSHITVVISD